MPSQTSTIVGVSLALLALLGPLETADAAPPLAPTDVATIEATAPLAEPSEAGVRAAITHAVQKAARGALAMGFTWLRVQNAYVRPGYVGVQVVAMTHAPDDESDAPPNLEREPPAPGEAAPDGDDRSQRIRL
jgi:hypothetical protein